jgi:hypothetical protein
MPSSSTNQGWGRTEIGHWPTRAATQSSFSVLGPFSHRRDTHTVGLKNPGLSPFAWNALTPRETSPSCGAFFSCPVPERLAE